MNTGRVQLAAEERARDVAVVEVELREGPVDKVDVVPVVVLGAHVLVQDDVHVLRLPLLRPARPRHQATTRVDTTSSPRAAAPSRPRTSPLRIRTSRAFFAISRIPLSF